MTSAEGSKRVRHWAGIDEVGFVFGMKFLFALYRFLGKWPFRGVLYPVLLWYLAVKPEARRASRAYLQRIEAIRGRSGKLSVFRHFAAFAETVLDKLRLWSQPLDADAAILFGQRPLLDLIARKKGCLLICAHFGNLDLCRIMAKTCPDLTVNFLVHTKNAERFNRLLGDMNPDSQLNLLQVTDMNPATAIALKERVDRGEFIAIAGDRVPVSQNPRVVWAEFLGKPAPFPIGPYVLAGLLACPVYLLFSMTRNRKPEIHFEPFAETVTLSRKERDDALRKMVGDYAARLTAHCLKAPLQWFNFYDFWQQPTQGVTDAE